jgi:hypothetical protein
MILTNDILLYTGSTISKQPTYTAHSHSSTHPVLQSVHLTSLPLSTHSSFHFAKHLPCTFFPHPILHHSNASFPSPSPSPSPSVSPSPTPPTPNPSRQIEQLSPSTSLRFTCISSHPTHSHQAPRHTMHVAGESSLVERQSAKQDACTVRPQPVWHHTRSVGDGWSGKSS